MFGHRDLLKFLAFELRYQDVFVIIREIRYQFPMNIGNDVRRTSICFQDLTGVVTLKFTVQVTYPLVIFFLTLPFVRL